MSTKRFNKKLIGLINYHLFYTSKTFLNYHSINENTIKKFQISQWTGSPFGCNVQCPIFRSILYYLFNIKIKSFIIKLLHCIFNAVLVLFYTFILTFDRAKNHFYLFFYILFISLLAVFVNKISLRRGLTA